MSECLAANKASQQVVPSLKIYSHPKDEIPWILLSTVEKNVPSTWVFLASKTRVLAIHRCSTCDHKHSKNYVLRGHRRSVLVIRSKAMGVFLVQRNGETLCTSAIKMPDGERLWITHRRSGYSREITLCNLCSIRNVLLHSCQCCIFCDKRRILCGAVVIL